jgi:peptide/nickel transport system permease protein
MDALRTIARKPVSLLGLIVVTLYFLAAFVGPFVIAPAKRAPKDKYQPPSAAHPLGTDIQGKDNLIQLVYGAKDVLIVALATAVASAAIGITLGAIAALAGGWVDSVISGVASIVLAIPALPLLVVLATVIRLDNPLLAAVVLSIFRWPGLMREVRAQMMSLKKRDYVEAALLLNMGWPHVIFKEMLPNMMSFIAITFITSMTTAIYAQTTLAFLGLIPLSAENWGVAFSNAYGRSAHLAANSAWAVLAPALTIVVFQLALVALQQGLDEVFNPRLRVGR